MAGGGGELPGSYSIVSIGGGGDDGGGGYENNGLDGRGGVLSSSGGGGGTDPNADSSKVIYVEGVLWSNIGGGSSYGGGGARTMSRLTGLWGSNDGGIALRPAMLSLPLSAAVAICSCC